MNIIKNEFWSTPVWEIETNFDNYFNSILVNDIAEFAGKDGFNIWDHDRYSIRTLKDKIFECLDATVKPYFPDFNPYEPSLLDGWGNKTDPGESLVLHSHPHAILIVTYYAKSPENSGDLLIVDPRGSVNWDWEIDNSPKRVHGINFKRIKATEGKLVIFPAYLMHMVEVNRSKETRICIATNIHNQLSRITYTDRPGKI